MGSARWDDTLDTAPSVTLSAIDTAVPGLPELAVQANHYHHKAHTSARTALEAARCAGSALLAAKAQCAHGEWLGWLAANFTGSERTAQSYMRLAGKYADSADLDPDQSIDSAIKALCKTQREPPAPPQDEPEQEPPEQESPERQPESQAAQQDSPEQPKPEPKRQSVPQDFSDEMDLLEAAVDGCVDIISQIMRDERYPRARKRIAESELPRLGACIAVLTSLLEAIRDELRE